LARASASIPASSSPLSVEVRREEGIERDGGEATREGGAWCVVSGLSAPFLTRLILDVAQPLPSSSTQPNSWFSS
jgi:hypothetical protein